MSKMSCKIHSSQGQNVPFSWENKPGVSKEAGRQKDHSDHLALPKSLPPPPGPPPPENHPRSSFHDMQIPLPPCAFQPPRPSRSSSRKGFIIKKIDDDPFLIAYKEVTKTSNKTSKLSLSSGTGGSKGDQGLGLLKNMSIFSCKQPSSCNVMEGSVIRLSQIPISRSGKD